MRGITWSEYETLLAIRGDRAGLRIAYLKGDLEIMSPSIDHDAIKKTMARLLEAYAEERDLELNGYGSWTVKSALAAGYSVVSVCGSNIACGFGRLLGRR